MPQVLVRDLDSATIDRLKERARLNGRSLQREIKIILEREALALPVDLQAQLARLDRMFAGRTFSDSAELIREDRDR